MTVHENIKEIYLNVQKTGCHFIGLEAKMLGALIDDLDSAQTLLQQCHDAFCSMENADKARKFLKKTLGAELQSYGGSGQEQLRRKMMELINTFLTAEAIEAPDEPLNEEAPSEERLEHVKST